MTVRRIVQCSVVLVIVIGIVGCRWFDRDRQNSPTAPVGSALELGQYAQQAGLSRVVTVNGVTHQINGVVAGHPLGGLYIELNEQNGTGHAPGEHQVPVSLRDVKVAFSGLPSGVTAIQVLSKTVPESPEFVEIGRYAVTSGGVELSLTIAQWTQWFGPTHWAVVCKAIGSGTLKNAAVAIAGVLPDGTAVALGQGFASGGPSGSCPACPASPSCPAGTCNPNALPTFVNNGDGTITDTRTGLVWLRNANCTETLGGIPKALPGWLNWNQAQTWVAALGSGSCGLTDGSSAGQWRQPTVKELQSLLDYSQIPIATWLNGQGFTNVQTGWYWTSTDYGPGSTHAWCVLLNIGYVYDGNKTIDAYYVWAVR